MESNIIKINDYTLLKNRVKFNNLIDQYIKNSKKIDCSYFNLKSLRFVHTFLEDSWKERRRLSKYDYCTEVIDCRGNNLDCLDLRGMDCLKEVHCDRGLEVLLNSDLDRSKIIHEY